MIERFKDFKIGNLICNFVICNLLIGTTFLYAQVDTAWVRRYNGLGDSTDVANALVVDSQGNVYVTGQSGGFGTGPDYLTIKYNFSGDTVWTRRYNGPGSSNDHANAIAVDPQGNVYVTGGSDNDFVTIKYSSNGEFLWLSRYNGPANGGDDAGKIALDNAGNVYVAGNSNDSGTFWDYATVKYNSAGIEQWVTRYNGPENEFDLIRDLTVDGQGNIYVTGSSVGEGANYEDCATIKYNTNGDTVWVRRYNGPTNGADIPKALALDGQGNIYIHGSSSNSGCFLTIKYNSSGDTLWVRNFLRPGAASCGSSDLAVDNQGNVYVTGYMNMPDASYMTVKYNSLGDTLWSRIYDYLPGSYNDNAYKIALDNAGCVYVTGASSNGSSNDWATIKYSPNGIEQWVVRYDGPEGYADRPYDIAVDGQYNVYVTGYTRMGSAGSTNDYATIKYAQTTGIEENRASLSANRLSLEVYPNPAKAFFNIKCTSSAGSVKIFDVSGKMVKEEKLKGLKIQRILLDGIENGVYFVKISHLKIIKLVVKN